MLSRVAWGNSRQPWREVEVHNKSRSSTWSLQALGFSMSWTAETTRQVPARLISWESTSGLKNAGSASFRALPDVDEKASCEVEAVDLRHTSLFQRQVRMSIRAPSFLRRIFQSRRLSAVAASAIGKDLRGFRQVVLARPWAGYGQLHVRRSSQTERSDGTPDEQHLQRPPGLL